MLQDSTASVLLISTELQWLLLRGWLTLLTHFPCLVIHRAFSRCFNHWLIVFTGTVFIQRHTVYQERQHGFNIIILPYNYFINPLAFSQSLQVKLFKHKDWIIFPYVSICIKTAKGLEVTGYHFEEHRCTVEWNVQSALSMYENLPPAVDM